MNAIARHLASMATTTAAAPIVLTLELDTASQRFFDALRQQHFPKDRSFLAAHLTLFHHLPGARYDDIRALVAAAAASHPPLPVSVTGVRFLGRGVAYTLESARLLQLHGRLQRGWHAELTAQDRQKLNSHVTVQNKVEESVARELHRELAGEFKPFQASGVALQLWAYRGGPWEPLEMFPFLEEVAKPEESLVNL